MNWNSSTSPTLWKPPGLASECRFAIGSVALLACRLRHKGSPGLPFMAVQNVHLVTLLDKLSDIHLGAGPPPLAVGSASKNGLRSTLAPRATNRSRIHFWNGSLRTNDHRPGQMMTSLHHCTHSGQSVFAPRCLQRLQRRMLPSPIANACHQ